MDTNLLATGDGIRAWVALRRQRGDGNFELVLRWFLGSSHNERLPGPDDVFFVKAQLRKSKLWLHWDGQFKSDEPTGSSVPCTAPRKFAMLAPPQGEITAPYDSELAVSRDFLINTRPTAPIEAVCSADVGTRPEKGFGVYHLLCETNEMRQMFRTAALCEEPIRRVLEERNAQLGGFRNLKMALSPRGLVESLDHTAINLAMHFAYSLAHGVPRARFLREGFHRHVRALHLEASKLISPREPLVLEDDVFAIGKNTAAERFEYAAVLGGLMRDEALVEEIDFVNTQPTNGRTQQRLRTLTGGKLIDFWCSVDKGANLCAGPPETPPAKFADTDRGRQYSAAELLGQGMTLGSFTQAEVEQWQSDSEALDIQIEGRSGFMKVTCWELDGALSCESDQEAGWLLTEEATRDPEGFCTCLLPSDIDRALEKGSSRPIASPPSARVDYDLRRVDGAWEKEEGKVSRGSKNPQYGYGTGEGQVKIRIQHPPKSKFTICNPGCNSESTVEQQTVFAFNVYGMWEKADTAQFFTEAPATPTLADLKPYLITRRYSYELELKPALADATGQPIDALQEALDDPPWMPHFLTPETTRERIVSEPKFSADPNEPPKSPKKDWVEIPNPDLSGTPETIWMFDLRSGMESGKSDNKFVGWDPQYWIKESWSPRRNRWSDDGDEDLETPQRYRFWVTAVDAFDQESEPKPVLAHDEQGGEEETYIYAPRFRTPMLPPDLCELPADEGGSTGKPSTRGLKYVAESGRHRLELRWRTPISSSLGTTGENQANVRPVPEDELIFEYVIFRRILRKKIETGSRFREELLLESSLRRLGLSYQWGAVIERLAGEGWAIWNWRSNCLASDTSCVELEQAGQALKPALWRAKITLAPPDLGFEYIAGVAAKINDHGKLFWAPDALYRKVRLGDDKAEIVRSTNVAETSIVPVSNPAEPRGLVEDFLTEEWRRADPVLPPAPEINRDWVLSRLVTMDFVDDAGQPFPRKVWVDTKYLVTAGQEIVCETALERVRGISPPSERFALLATARRLMVQDFGIEIGEDDLSPEPLSRQKQFREQAGVAPTVYRQHKSIGFRGIQEFSWQYAPNSQQPLGSDEAEAVRFRIYGVRVPIDSGGEEGSASSDNLACVTTPTLQNNARVGSARKQSGTKYVIEVPTDQEEKLASICSGKNGDNAKVTGNLPALVRVDCWPTAAAKPDKTKPIFGSVRNQIIYKTVKDASGREVLWAEIELQLEPGKVSSDLFEHALIRVYKADEIDALVEDVDVTRTKAYRLLLPVGGGRREVFCWWIGTLSAQEREATNVRRLSFIRRMPETLVPEPPANFAAFQPFDEGTHDIDFPDDPTIKAWLKQFLPFHAHDPNQQEPAPRVVLAWGDDLGLGSDGYFLPDGVEDGKGIFLARDYREVVPGSRLLDARIMPLQHTAWDAIVDITNAKDTDKLKESDLGLLRGWLNGGVITTPSDLEGRTTEEGNVGVHLARAPRALDTRHLTIKGLKPVAYPIESANGTQKPVRSGFVDLYQDNWDSGGANNGEIMDMNREYRYYAQAYIDLAHTDPSSGLVGDPRYLISPPTPWTGWVRPARTPIELGESEPPEEHKQELVLPRVRFLLSTELTPGGCQPEEKALTLASSDKWSYRIIIQRKFPFSLKVDPTPDANSATPEPWGAIAEPVDIDPQDCAAIVDYGLERDEWDEALEVLYRIRIKQFSRDHQGREVLMRSFESDLKDGKPIKIRAPKSGETGEIEHVYRVKIN